MTVTTRALDTADWTAGTRGAELRRRRETADGFGYRSPQWAQPGEGRVSGSGHRALFSSSMSGAYVR